MIWFPFGFWNTVQGRDLARTRIHGQEDVRIPNPNGTGKIGDRRRFDDSKTTQTVITLP